MYLKQLLIIVPLLSNQEVSHIQYLDWLQKFQ